jgi:hypothetical protein
MAHRSNQGGLVHKSPFVAQELKNGQRAFLSRHIQGSHLGLAPMIHGSPVLKQRFHGGHPLIRDGVEERGLSEGIQGICFRPSLAEEIDEGHIVPYTVPENSVAILVHHCQRIMNMITEPPNPFVIANAEGMEQRMAFSRSDRLSKNGEPEFIVLAQLLTGGGGKPGFVGITGCSDQLKNESDVLQMGAFSTGFQEPLFNWIP